MSSLQFAGRHRKDLSTEMIRTKIAHRKSLSQKENRHKKYEQNRHFGLKDVNIPILQDRNLELSKTTQELVLKNTKETQCEQRKQMLQKYKEEKQLRKLKEQREKTKQGIFKTGLYRPDKPHFLCSNQKTMKTDSKKDFQSSVRITRSKAKEQMEQTKIKNGSDVWAIQPGQRQTSEKKFLDKEKRALQSAVPTSMRMTRSATQSAKQTVRETSSTARMPECLEAEKESSSKGRPPKKLETKPTKVVSFKTDNEKNTLDSQTTATNGMDPDEVLAEKENSPKTNTTKTKRKDSFAPKDFMFHPLNGVKTYQVQPMTPRSANAFLTPSFTWMPSETEIHKTQEATKENLIEKCESYSVKTIHQDSNTLECSLSSLSGCHKEHGLNKNGTTKHSNDLPTKEVLSLEMNEAQICQPQHDVPYFRNVLQSETETLTSYCLEWDTKLQLDIPDTAKDLIRTTVGQTRLLMRERFRQFEGLVDNCEYKRGEKETTCTDLDGFWDMVSFQIEDVKQKFNNLTKLEESGWQSNNTSKKVFRKKVVSGMASKPKQDDDGRIAARNRLAAIKNAMREKIKQKEHAETADSIIPKEVDKIVFDAGFFRVESPVKSFSGLSISSDHLSQRLRTPKFGSSEVTGNRAEVDHLAQVMPPEIAQPALFENKSHTVECHLDSPRPSSSNPFIQMEKKQQHTRQVSFGGDLITFSPLRPLSGEQP